VELSVISDEIDDDLGVALDFCETVGIRAVELRSVDGLSVIDHPVEALEQMRAELERREVRVCAIASSFLKCDRENVLRTAGRMRDAPLRTRAEQEAVLARTMLAADVLAAPIVRAFSYWRELDPLAAVPGLARELREAAATAAAAGLTLALENEHECNVGSAEEVVAVLREASSAPLGVIWDPANAAALNPRAFTELGGFHGVCEHVVHVHLKDVDGEGRWVRIGEGVVDHGALLRALDARGYEGCLSVETHYERDGSRAAATRECVESVRAIARQAGLEL
jgi:L-ribulose-5-phosphate 3-epimerase